MNVALSFVFLLLLLPFQVDGAVFLQRLPRPSSDERHLQREENESDTSSADFLDEVTAEILMPNPIEDFSNLAAFIDALVASASASEGPSFYSNWSSTLRRSDLTNDQTGSLNEAAGSAAFSSSGEFGNTVGSDINMADGDGNAAVVQLPYVAIASIIALNAVALVLEVNN
ncbi:hypothetical protein PRNP1_013183 [Phytophthora ramorum]|uniref:uncharacterized protein n=1 Tax=Phytophthora ramorum TaxID=164328 RepID=UPI0030B565A8|nr:hypothetical protein KRP23_14090 [Phytophthora ramorum]